MLMMFLSIWIFRIPRYTQTVKLVSHIILVLTEIKILNCKSNQFKYEYIIFFTSPTVALEQKFKSAVEAPQLKPVNKLVAHHTFVILSSPIQSVLLVPSILAPNHLIAEMLMSNFSKINYCYQTKAFNLLYFNWWFNVIIMYNYIIYYH